MDIGIVGLPKSGKTTIFNAVTRGRAQVSAHTGPQAKPNMGVAKVADERLGFIGGIFKPKRQVPAEVTYVDIPTTPEGLGETRGISGEFLNELQRTDALMITVRAFEDPSVPHQGDGVDPFRDAETMLYELAFADLEILTRRLGRLSDQSKGAKPAEREAQNKEEALLERLKVDLESGVAVRDQGLDVDEARLLEGFQLLTAKPAIIVVNTGEAQLSDAQSLETRLAAEFPGPRVGSTALCGKLEMELAQMSESEEMEFRESLEIGESGLERMIKLSQDVLDLITFFTGNANEVRAWNIPRGTSAVEAAGKIHTDIQRGFIRAEVVGFDDLAECGSVSEARRRGVLRQEGKTYLVDEGDVVNILFNV